MIQSRKERTEELQRARKSGCCGETQSEDGLRQCISPLMTRPLDPFGNSTPTL
jgi:hypothetical protein